MFREVAASKHSNKGKLRDYYYAALDIKSEKSSGGKPVTIPQAVKGGYLHCKDGQYYIRPVCGEVLRLSRKHSDFYALDVEYAQHKPVCYRDSDRGISVALPGTSKAHAGMKKGMLMSIGKSVKGMGPCYIFPEEDSQAEVLQLSDWEILSYREDFKMRQNSLKAYDNPNFWALPKAGNCVPIFYAQHTAKPILEKAVFCGLAMPTRFLKAFLKNIWSMQKKIRFFWTIRTRYWALRPRRILTVPVYRLVIWCCAVRRYLPKR